MHAEAVFGYIEQVFAQLAAGNFYSGAGKIGLARCGRGSGLGGERSVGSNDAHVFKGHANFLGCNLGDHVQKSLPDFHGPGIDFEFVFFVEADPRTRGIGETVAIAQTEAEDGHAVAAFDVRGRSCVGTSVPNGFCGFVTIYAVVEWSDHNLSRSNDFGIGSTYKTIRGAWHSSVTL